MLFLRQFQDEFCFDISLSYLYIFISKLASFAHTQSLCHTSCSTYGHFYQVVLALIVLTSNIIKSVTFWISLIHVRRGFLILFVGDFFPLLFLNLFLCVLSSRIQASYSGCFVFWGFFSLHFSLFVLLSSSLYL